MYSRLFMMLLCLISVFSFNSVVAIQTDDSKSLKLSETSNKYASSQLYVFGGFQNDHSISSASQFNSSTGNWEATTDMTVAKIYSCGAVVGTKIYLFGGMLDGGVDLKTAEVYDCETGTYSQFRSMPSPRHGCGAAVLDGFIYVAGGYHSGALSSVIRYNIETTRREDVSPMHSVRDDLQLVELGGRLYAIGGYNTKTVEMYNPATNQWTAVASIKYEHKHFGAAVHEGKIYVCSDAGFETYSPGTDGWETLSPLNNLDGSKLVSMNDKLWALGGGSSGSKLVHTYNTMTKNWSEQTEMDTARRWHNAFVVIH